MVDQATKNPISIEEIYSRELSFDASLSGDESIFRPSGRQKSSLRRPKSGWLMRANACQTDVVWSTADSWIFGASLERCPYKMHWQSRSFRVPGSHC
ncbi:hypothetical protein GPL21_00475 [Bradyrhizobium pachyrhizi]|uniref:Uncharacterized protein n=1 Tax=Bradyrhizobium pachyrhizi TaxID=280333 RepID=A0A844SHN3_9BRAD|nr:hypothetical protein [Bradyrhizobium pachyrhizi]MVT63589.1 hypothetical protein [Bradyrhizobium pachyrhizi]